MNNKFNYFSKILYVFLVIFCFSCINVYAEEQEIDRTEDLCSGSPKLPENQHLVQQISNSCLNYMCNNQLETRYTANVELVSGEYKITLDATAEKASEKSEHSKVKFYLVDQNNNKYALQSDLQMLNEKINELYKKIEGNTNNE